VERPRQCADDVTALTGKLTGKGSHDNNFAPTGREGRGEGATVPGENVSELVKAALEVSQARQTDLSHRVSDHPSGRGSVPAHCVSEPRPEGSRFAGPWKFPRDQAVGASELLQPALKRTGRAPLAVAC
jgi:hypothetical protein